MEPRRVSPRVSLSRISPVDRLGLSSYFAGGQPITYTARLDHEPKGQCRSNQSTTLQILANAIARTVPAAPQR